MLTSVLLALACAAPAEAPKGPVPPARELFAKEDFYKSQKGKEQDFVGSLRFEGMPDGVVGIGRYNPYKLDMVEKGKKDVREVYVGGKPGLLRPYVGRRVKITGKPVELEVVGKVHREIWPARIEVVKVAAPEEEECCALEPAAKTLPVVASAYWGGAGAAPRQQVARSGAELAALRGLPAAKADEATAELVKRLKVAGIDWTKQMVVVVTAGRRNSGGYRVEVTSLSVGDTGLTVHWKVHAPSGFATAAITHPGVAVLTERYAGAVRFDPAVKAAPGRD
jgi:hypothetical protein